MTKKPITNLDELTSISFAFPYSFTTPERAYHGLGMTIRDYFAAKALHALITEPQFNNMPALMFEIGQSADLPSGSAVDRYAHAAYLMADAMIRASKS